MKPANLFGVSHWLLYAPVAIIFVVAAGLLLLVAKPLPPTKIFFGVGPAQSSYLKLAQVYAARLERQGIEVEILTHSRPQEALERLGTAGEMVSVAFAQGLYARPGLQVQSLGTVGNEVVWVFGRASLDGLSSLKGKRLAASDADSSSRKVASILLAHSGVNVTEVTFSPLVGESAVTALSEGHIDAVLHIASSESNTVSSLARLEGVRLIPVTRAAALGNKERQLRPVVIPQGSIELHSNIPSMDVTTVASQTHLLVRPEMHPALQRALIDTMNELHTMGVFPGRQEQYPSLNGNDFSVSPVAKEFSVNARPWLESLLPYRTAQLAEVLLFGLLPFSALAAFLLRRVPVLIEWRVNAQLQFFYGELKFLESDMGRLASTDPIALRWVVTRLDGLEAEVATMNLPDRFADRWYTLREHLASARERLLDLRGR